MAFLDVIARQVLALRESSGARLPLVLMNSFHTREDSLALLERYDGLGSDVPFDFVQHKEPKLLVDGLEPADWPADPQPRVVPARARRHLPGAAHLGDARAAARARLPLRVHVQLRQPRRGARPADPRLDRGRGAALRVRGDRPHRGRQEGRSHRAAEGDRRADPARDRADARRGHGRVHRRRAPPVLPRQQPLGRPAGARRAAARARRRARAADDRQREDASTRPTPPRPRSTSSRRRWARRSACSRARGRSACRARASCRSRRPPICWCCARTPTCSATARGSSSRTGATARRSSSSTTTTSSCSPTSTLAFPEGPPSLVAAERLAVEGDVTFGRDVTVRGVGAGRGSAPGRGRRRARGLSWSAARERQLRL